MPIDTFTINHAQEFLFQAPPQTIDEYDSRERNALLPEIMWQLKQCPPLLFQKIMISLLKNKKSPIAKEMLLPIYPVYGRILCWQLRRIGMSHLRSFMRDWEDPRPCAAFIIATSGYTEELIKFAKDFHIRIHFLDLEELVKAFHPRMQPLMAEHRRTSIYNIKFPPESNSI